MSKGKGSFTVDIGGFADDEESDYQDESSYAEITPLKPPEEGEPTSATLRRVRTEYQQAVEVADNRLKDKLNELLKEETFFSRYCNKGNMSNFISFLIMILGIVLFEVSKKKNDDGKPDEYAKYILSFGLFSFSGGITNWIAIKMLFDKIPLLYGSGVISREFNTIKKSVRNIVMEVIFDREILEDYIKLRSADLMERLDLEGLALNALRKENLQMILEDRIKDAAKGKKPLNKLVKAITRIQKPTKLAKMVRPMLSKIVAVAVPEVVNSLNIESLVDMDTIEREFDNLLTQKLDMLTPDVIKALIERLIRDHLGWLVVWGNLFGGIIGLVTQAASLGP